MIAYTADSFFGGIKMTAFEITFGIILMVLAVILIVAVLLQSGKEKGLSGTLVGGADTFFGKNKGNTWDRVLSKLTTALSIVFAIATVVMYIVITTK